MRNVWNTLIAVVVIAGLGLSTQARAQTAADDALGSTTLGLTTFGPITITGGIIVLIVLLTKHDNRPRSEEAVRATELFLKQNSVQLAQDLSTGKGPLVSEMARAMHIRPENQATFSRLLRDHRGELMALANPDALNRAKALQFVQTLVNLMESDAGLRADLHAFAASAQVN